MKFCENLLIFGFLFFPTFIFGLKCGAGGSCYGNTRKHLGSPFSLLKRKNAKMHVFHSNVLLKMEKSWKVQDVWKIF
uniref:Uncharacterized protein n=1 Tax=Panagrolaimus superbus TaxID=310955 RepID=A0A914YUJ8_9BILA